MAFINSCCYAVILSLFRKIYTNCMQNMLTTNHKYVLISSAYLTTCLVIALYIRNTWLIMRRQCKEGAIFLQQTSFKLLYVYKFYLLTKFFFLLKENSQNFSKNRSLKLVLGVKVSSRYLFFLFNEFLVIGCCWNN